MSTLWRETHNLYLTSRERSGVIPLVELKEFHTFRLHIFFFLHYSCSYSPLLSLPLCAKYILGNVKSNSLVLMPCPSSISVFLATCYSLGCPTDNSCFVSHPSLCLLPFPTLDFSHSHTPSSKWGCPFFARLIDKLWDSNLKCTYICFLMILGLINISHGTRHGQPIFLFNLFLFQSKVTS